jgi:hypothetical protein
MHEYEVRPPRNHRSVDLISHALPFDRLWYGEPNAINNAIGYAMHRSRSHDAVIRVYDAAGNVTKRTSTRAISAWFRSQAAEVPLATACLLTCSVFGAGDCNRNSADQKKICGALYLFKRVVVAAKQH